MEINKKMLTTKYFLNILSFKIVDIILRKLRNSVFNLSKETSKSSTIHNYIALSLLV